MGLSPLSPAHYKAIDILQRAILFGGLFLFIVFRGFAKSTLAEVATIWGTTYGHLKFPVPIGADAGAAKICLESIKAELETNQLLYDDFPEVCHAVRALEGKPQRCNSQTYAGKLTRIEWTANHIVLPTIPGSPASGGIIKPKGITANIRGLRHKLADGRQARPDFIILDDPQTDKSAKSPDQVQKNLSVLNKGILRLGGHRSKLAAVCNATIIEPDDMVDQLADQEKYPAWQTEKIPMLKSFADKHEEKWLGEYAEIRNTYTADIEGDQDRAKREATEFYNENREDMDKGAEATWLSCFDPETELSAIQHAYNILVDTGNDAFMAECQNAPVALSSDVEALPPAEIARKVNGFKRGEIPATCDNMTAFIDVQGKLLYWLVAAWSPDFTGYIVDYGAFPEQKRRYFTLRDARATLRRKYRGTDDEGAIFRGLTDCIGSICGREYLRDDGAAMRLDRCLVDANWGGTSSLVNQACRQSEFAPILTPSYGRGIKSTQKPISQWHQAKGRRCGPEWVPTKASGKQLVGVLYDANYWKKRFSDALALGQGSPGAITLFKNSPAVHRMAADHLAAEILKKVEHDGRVVYEATAKPNVDNHLLDCAVGSMVAASICGVSNRKDAPAPRRKRKVKLS